MGLLPRRLFRRLQRLTARQWAHWLSIQLRTTLGIPARLDSPDRHVLEQQLLPHFAGRPEMQRVLFVGCDWYSKHYQHYFSHARRFLTLDADPRQRRYGGPEHLTGSMEGMANRLAPSSLDLIVCNGVFGYGLDTPEQVALAMRAAYSCLRPGGELLFGWNDIPAHAPFDPAEAIGDAGFERVELLPLGRWRTTLPMPTRHTFEAYRRPVAAG